MSDSSSTLNVLVTANNTSLVNGMQQSEQAVNKFHKSTKDASTGASKFAQVATLLGTSFVALAALAGVGFAGFSLFKELQDISAIGAAAKKFGETTEAMSALAYAAKRSGLDLETFQQISKHMTRTLGEAQQGSASAVKEFNNLNIDFSKFGMLSFADQVKVVSDRIAGMTDPAQKMSSAMALFGRSGDEILPFLNRGAAGIEELMKKAQQSGQVFGNDAVKGYKEFKESFKDLQDIVTGVFRQIAVASTPYLAKIGQAIKDTIQWGRDWYSEWKPIIDQIRDIFSSAFNVIRTVASDAWNDIKEAAGPLMKWLGDDVPQTMMIVKSAIVIGLTHIEVAFQNWEDVVGLALLKVTRAFVSFALDINDAFSKAYQVMVVIGQAMVKTLAEVTLTVLQNIENLKKFIASGGKEKFEFNWGNFEKGFQDAIGNMGRIIGQERPLAPMEKFIDELVDHMENKLGVQLDAKLKQRMKAMLEAGQEAQQDIKKALPDVAGKVQTSVKVETVSAVQQGSVEAFSAINKARLGNENQQLAEAKKANNLLQQLINVANANNVPFLAAAVM